MKSIQGKILVVVISALLVITAIVSLIAVNMTHEIMHTDADRILENATQKEAAQINDTLGDVKKSAAIMEHFVKMRIESLEALRDEDTLQEYLKETEDMFIEVAVNTNAVKGFYFRVNPEYSNSTAGYYNIVNDDKSIKKMQVTDLSKYAANDTRNVGWYYTPINAGRAMWLEPYYFPGYDFQLISYSVPVFVDSKLLGVIGFDMDFGYLVSQIDEISVYDEGYAVLIASDGETAYNAKGHQESVNPHTKATVELQNGMFLELRADYKDIQSNIHPMLSRIVMAFLVVLFFAIVYTVFVTRQIVRPLKQLTVAAESISSGNGMANLAQMSVKSNDEIGTLSNVLSDAYAKINEYTTYINALAYRDPLTGIKNVTAYTEAVAEMNKAINCNNPSFGVVVADINNLKQTNDKYGHDVGNDLIVHTAKILTETFKTSSVFRIGGDEFVIILKGADFDAYRDMLANLDEACSKNFITVCENKIPVSIARGIAIYDPEIDKVYEDVFAKADHAMYLNKNESKLVLS